MALIDDVLVAAEDLRRAKNELEGARNQRQVLVAERDQLVQQLADADAAIVAKQTALQEARQAFKTLVAGL